MRILRHDCKIILGLVRYKDGIDAMVLLADNDEHFLLRAARKLLEVVSPGRLEAANTPIALSGSQALTASSGSTFSKPPALLEVLDWIIRG
jgi:hypothetical protein